MAAAIYYQNPCRSRLSAVAKALAIYRIEKTQKARKLEKNRKNRIRGGKNLGHSIQKIFSKFGHSSEFRVFSLENIENLALNLRPGSVYQKSSFRYGPSFPSLIGKSFFLAYFWFYVSYFWPIFSPIFWIWFFFLFCRWPRLSRFSGVRLIFEVFSGHLAMQ